MEDIVCPICGSKENGLFLLSHDFRFGISREAFRISRCGSCGFIFLNPRPAENEISVFYPEDFNRQDMSFFYSIIQPCFTAAQKSTVRLLAKYARKGKVLDIGCGNGEFLGFMQKKGFDVYGVEPNPGADKFIRSSLKGRIFYQKLQECNFQENSFDIITMFQSLEHVYDLDILFKEIKRILKNEGVLYICVPNTGFFESLFFGSYYYNLEVPRHLYFFTKKSLQALLAKHGFQRNRFFKDSFFEAASTPASFYYGVQYFLKDRGIEAHKIFFALFFFPLVLLRFFMRLFFILDNQNLKVLVQRT